MMFSYKDKTYCGHSHKCANLDCDSNFAKEVKMYKEMSKDAGFNLPVAYADLKTNDCGYLPIQSRVLIK